MDALRDAIQPALDHEKSQWVLGSVDNDPFYACPPYDSAQDKPGKLLRVQEAVETSNFFLPPGLALSRIVYLSRNAQGVVVPVSAFILWPFSPRTDAEGKYRVVAWAHGTSSAQAEGAPSHHKNLWQHFLAPYPLALNGYVVVATDYAGQGVLKDAAGRSIAHPYGNLTSHGHDVLYAVQAAREAFATLSQQFVVVGHSQGGGATWAAAQHQATAASVPGCLGCIALTPLSRLLDESKATCTLILGAGVAGLQEYCPELELDEILTDDGRQRLQLFRETRAGLTATLAILAGQDLFKPEFENHEAVRKYQEYAAPGGKRLGCPLLIVHGHADPVLSFEVARAWAKKTADAFPDAHVELVGLPGCGHDHSCTVGRAVWMDWIAARFAGQQLQPGFSERTLEPARPVEAYHPRQNWYMAPASQPFHAPGV